MIQLGVQVKYHLEWSSTTCSARQAHKYLYPIYISNTNFLERLDYASHPLPENDAIDPFENVSVQVSQGWVQTDFPEATYSMPTPLLDNDMSHCTQTDFLQETYSIPSPLLGKEARHSSKTTSPEGSFCLVSPKTEKDLLHTIQTGKLRKRSRLLDRCDNENSITLEQQSSQCHEMPAPINASALQLYHLADTTEAQDACVSNNIDISARTEALGAASSKSSRVSHTLERNSIMPSDKSMPVLDCQSFSIPVPSNSPTINERAHQAFCESKKLISLSSNLSVKYKIKPLDGVYQSLPSKFENLMSRSLAYSIDTNHLDSSYDSKKLGVLDFDGSFMMSNDQTSSSSNVYSVQEDSDVPSTLSFEKYELEALHGMTGSCSDYLGSIPGFGCFKIDEDSTILGGTGNQEKPSHSIGRHYLRQCLGCKRAPGYATNLYRSKGTSSLDLTIGKPYTRKSDQHVHIRVNRDIKNLKEVRALSTMNSRETTHPLHDRLNKTEMSCSKSERSRKGTKLEKGCRPRNTVSNMASFIPIVKQNQRPPKSCAKGDVRVRALKVAAAVKRREEKKQAEREMLKAAVKLELERLKQEKEHRRKQVEHKKMEADFIIRKRQREGDGKQENDKKKKGAEVAPKHQKQLDTMKNACPNDTAYEMSPYEDSDEKNFENSEHKREISCKRKLIPPWAQKENLHKILLSNLTLDPRKVFAHGCSLILSDGD